MNDFCSIKKIVLRTIIASSNWDDYTESSVGGFRIILLKAQASERANTSKSTVSFPITVEETALYD
jgi:hypothetical protein